MYSLSLRCAKENNHLGIIGKLFTTISDLNNKFQITDFRMTNICELFFIDLPRFLSMDISSLVITALHFEHKVGFLLFPILLLILLILSRAAGSEAFNRPYKPFIFFTFIFENKFTLYVFTSLSLHLEQFFSSAP